ncbi:DUF1656 domain-containing protein [Alteromonas lipotrueiana]|uniref:DUF1656 domain-containing protein n=1 Tax=Alteromonas lipotrueiana TaxID=2803815 RepID=UPI001C483564|nr:DUF1656 domain-containing protein [Alteromonas lipotrueiana]|tara:strand:- start:157 stop:357 length:201 start_codon:yes stop_codon:yes gene_type:complete
MFEEIAFGGMLFSPLVIFMPVAFLLSVITRLVLYKTGLYQHVWRPAWLEVSLFVCYLAAVVFIAGR